MSLTDGSKLKKILLFINDFTKSNLRSPSYREIGKELEMSLGAVNNAIQKLHDDKCIKKIPNFVGIKLTRKGKEVLSPCEYDHIVEVNNMVEQLKKENISLIKENNGIRHDYIHNLQREEQNRQLLKECKKVLEWYAQCKCSKSMIDKEGIIFEFADKANKALTHINEVLK